MLPIDEHPIVGLRMASQAMTFESQEVQDDGLALEMASKVDSSPGAS